MRAKTRGGVWAVAVLLAAGAQVMAQGQMRITEWMYSGGDGEFIEFTNVGDAAVDMTGWSFDDDSNVPGTVSLTAFGMVDPGESVLLIESADTAAFSTAWGLSGVSIIGGNPANLGRNDAMNLYDNTNALVDSLLYGDDINAPGSIRTQNSSGWPCAEAVGMNNVFGWNLSTLGDAQGSFASSPAGNVGSPGSYTSVVCAPPGSGGCCVAGVCSIETGADCVLIGGVHLGDGSDCTGACQPSAAEVRITEYMYSGGDGEIIEITNLSAGPVDLTGWSIDDDSAIPGSVNISALGVLAPGASAVITDSDPATFETAWGLSGVAIVQNTLVGFGSNDEINLFDPSWALKDVLTYGSGDFPGTIHAQNITGWPCADVVGMNDITGWQYSTVGDSQNSTTSTGGDVGNPGQFTPVACNAVPTGACCSEGNCTDETATSCILGGRLYQGDSTDCGSFMCPAPSDGTIRITEYMYNDAPREFIEFTNRGLNPVDMTGWSFDDDSNTPGTVDLSAFGVVMPGESVILAEDTAASFIADWSLSGVTVIGENSTNLGRNDQINLYDSGGVLHDRLTYGDQTFAGTIRTVDISGYPCEDAVGADDIFRWFFSEVGDGQGSYTSMMGAIGNPGSYVDVACPVCGNGMIEVGEDCEMGDCCVNCRFADSATVCRASAGDCDVAESCLGDSADCPADGVAGAGTTCRDVAGDCDVAEVCDGMTPGCPPDAFTGMGTECRASAGDCDVAETCTGADPNCPTDGLAMAGTECRASTGACDPAETCDGASLPCPPNQVITSCLNGDGCCPSSCTANTDSDCLAVCGNNVIEPGEDCDDGNTVDGDGCSSTCQVEFVGIPTVSEWGLLVLALLLLTGAKLRFRQALAAQR